MDYKDFGLNEYSAILKKEKEFFYKYISNASKSADSRGLNLTWSALSAFFDQSQAIIHSQLETSRIDDSSSIAPIMILFRSLVECCFVSQYVMINCIADNSDECAKRYYESTQISDFFYQYRMENKFGESNPEEDKWEALGKVNSNYQNLSDKQKKDVNSSITEFNMHSILEFISTHKQLNNSLSYVIGILKRYTIASSFVHSRSNADSIIRKNDKSKSYRENIVDTIGVSLFLLSLQVDCMIKVFYGGAPYVQSVYDKHDAISIRASERWVQ